MLWLPLSLNPSFVPAYELNDPTDRIYDYATNSMQISYVRLHLSYLVVRRTMIEFSKACQIRGRCGSID